MESSSAWRRDAVVAIMLAAVLGVAWAAGDRANLSALRLPDTDDVVRLQQVRDWLAGQGWADLTQHRFGAAGLAMHWSRLGDLGPAAGIVALTPLVGRHAAEVASVAAWPAMLFAVALFLVARIARRLGEGLGATAAVIAAVAYPATTLFAPGRIDHHGLQMVLLLGAVLAMLRPVSVGAGIAAGMLGAASLAVGLETAPLFGMIGGAAVLAWVAGRDARGARLGGLGVGALAGLAIGRGVFATSGWAYPACDGFTGEAWRAATVLAVVPVALSAGSARVEGWRPRAALALVLGAMATWIALRVSPGCASPYGSVDPALAAAWLSKVGEAQPLLGATAATAWGYAGLPVAGVLASGWRVTVAADSGRARWALLLALQLAALAITFVQLRGAYAGALLAAPGLAAVVSAARRRGALPLAGAWAASAGMLYPLAASALTTGRGPVADAACDAHAAVPLLAKLPRGTVAGPVDLGAWGLAATPHRFLAAPYHRDGAGMIAADRLLHGLPETAAAITERWHVDYAVTCGSAPRGWRRVASADNATIWARDPLWVGPAPH